MAGRRPRAESEFDMGEAQKTISFTPEEFQNAVRSEAQKAVADLLAQNRAAANSHDDGGDASWVAKLAAEIAQLNNQGPSAKIYVSPDVLAQRKVSRKMMVESIIAARAQGDKPRYALRNKVFLNERLIDPFWIGADRQQHRTEIDWTGAPNESMIPINASAKEIFGHFKASIGTKTPVTDDRPISVTAAGLTVHAAPPKRRTNAAAEDGNLAAEFADDLGVAHREGGRPDGHLHVLGTLHPAIQEGAGTGRGT